MPIPPKPEWFKTTFTGWSHPTDVQCAKYPGRHAATVLHAVWELAPGFNQARDYRLSTNRSPAPTDGTSRYHQGCPANGSALSIG